MCTLGAQRTWGKADIFRPWRYMQWGGNGFYCNTIKRLLQKGEKGQNVKKEQHRQMMIKRRGRKLTEIDRNIVQKRDKGCEKAETGENLWLVLNAHSHFSCLPLSHVHPPSSHICFDPVNLAVNLNPCFWLAASVMWPHTHFLFQPHLLSWRCRFPVFCKKKKKKNPGSFCFLRCEHCVFFLRSCVLTRSVLSSPLILISQYLFSLIKSLTNSSVVDPLMS